MAKKKSKIHKFEKILSKRVSNKPILKKTQVVVGIKQTQTPSILNDPNRFFKNEFEQAKKEMFLQ